jgi:acylphosphatase
MADASTRQPIARRIVVHGQVQGVFFRASTDEVASHHGVVGWITNRHDGAVEAWLEGQEESVGAVEAWIRSGGPRSATVTDVHAQDVTPAGHTRFEVT